MGSSDCETAEITVNKRAWIVLGTAGTVAFMAAFAYGAWVMVHARTPAFGDVSEALDTGYRPTSKWVEEGVDPDVMQLGFGDDKKHADTPGRELSEGQLQQLVYAKQNALMPCYADALQDNPDLHGTVDMEFGIATDGHLSLVAVRRSSLEDKPTEDCLVERARGWKFPSTGRPGLMKFDTDFTFVYE